MLHRQRSAFDLNDLSESSPHATRHRNVNLTVRDLVIFALHIDSAMEYVATMKVRLLGDINFVFYSAQDFNKIWLTPLK